MTTTCWVWTHPVEADTLFHDTDSDFFLNLPSILSHELVQQGQPAKITPNRVVFVFGVLPKRHLPTIILFIRMNIIFIRHGQTTGDVEDRFGGGYDDHLTLVGRGQSELAREELKDKKIDLIVCSSFVRARETADILSQGTIPIVVENDMKERNQYGVLTGMVREEARQKFPELVERLKDKYNTIEGAESYEAFRERIQAAFHRLTSDSSHACIGVVWHGGPMRVLFRDILKKGELGKEIGDCAWVELRKDEDQFIIEDSKRIEFLF